MNQETLDLLALSLVPGLGAVRIHALLKEVGEAGEVIRASRSRLRGLRVTPEMEAFIASGCARRDAERAAELAESKGIRLLCLGDPAYPPLLAQIYDPPVVLYALGDPEVLFQPAVAMVGSRKCSVYGAEVAGMLSRDLARTGLAVVSGMARGIDGRAHAGALEVKGTTVAVLGTGVDVPYPRENRKLYGRIVEAGCVLSEFPMGSFPAPQNFPIRNRIISGLCLGTLIPEAAEYSGSLITARLTLEQNRELWAVPGNISSPGSYGPNYLIKQGAKPILAAQDVLDELPVSVLRRLERRAEAASPQSLPEGSERLDRQTERFLELVPVDETVHFDELLRCCKWTVARLSSVLLDLEMKGLVRQLPGRRYARRWLK